jgi:peptide/nickel transport system substrate-binding protein
MLSSLPRLLLAAYFTISVVVGGAAAQTLTIGIRSGPESMDPHFTALSPNIEAVKHIFDALVQFDDKLQLKPGLAESWSPVSSDTWEFRLRRGVKFHDGSDFTAEDVKFSFDRIPQITGPNPVTVYTRRVREVRIVDPYTVQIVTDGPAPTLPNDLVRVLIVSHNAAAGLAKDTASAAFNSGKAAIGTGPYRLVSWTPRDELVLERFDGYWGGRQPWQRVVRKELPNDAARLAQLLAGQVDMISRVPTSDMATLGRDGRITVATQDTIFVFLFDFDLREQSPQISARDGSKLGTNPFRDPRVREAIDLAIDRQALAEISMEGMGAVATQITSSGTFGYNPSLKPPVPDLARARQLLADAGFPNGFRFTLSFTIDRLPGDREVGTAIVQMLARIGIDAQANGLPVALLFSQRPRGDLSATMTGWGTTTGEAYYTYSAIAHSNDAKTRLGAFNWRDYRNPEVDRLVEAAGSELDSAKRDALLQQAAAVFTADRATLPLVTIKSAWALWRDRVKLLRMRVDEETLAMDITPAR